MSETEETALSAARDLPKSVRDSLELSAMALVRRAYAETAWVPFGRRTIALGAATVVIAAVILVLADPILDWENPLTPPLADLSWWTFLLWGFFALVALWWASSSLGVARFSDLAMKRRAIARMLHDESAAEPRLGWGRADRLVRWYFGARSGFGTGRYRSAIHWERLLFAGTLFGAAITLILLPGILLSALVHGGLIAAQDGEVVNLALGLREVTWNVLTLIPLVDLNEAVGLTRPKTFAESGMATALVVVIRVVVLGTAVTAITRALQIRHFNPLKLVEGDPVVAECVFSLAEMIDVKRPSELPVTEAPRELYSFPKRLPVDFFAEAFTRAAERLSSRAFPLPTGDDPKAERLIMLISSLRNENDLPRRTSWTTEEVVAHVGKSLEDGP